MRTLTPIYPSILIMLITVATAAANAIVVKPLNSIVAAKGTAKIANKDFFYSVQDRGWVESKKQFLINYVEANETESPLSLSEKVETDALQKCHELGRIELASKPLDTENKNELSAELIDHESERVQQKILRHLRLSHSDHI